MSFAVRTSHPAARHAGFEVQAEQRLGVSTQCQRHEQPDHRKRRRMGLAPRNRYRPPPMLNARAA